MDRTSFLPPADEADSDPLDDLSDDDAPSVLCWGPPPGLVQWVTLLDALHPERHGLGALEIAEVETVCICAMIDFESADFVVRTHNGRRFHLQGAIDADNGPDTVATSIEPMAPGQLLPFPVMDDEPGSQWSGDTAVFNAELARLRQSRAA
jgi:hypothetical protein